jgi:hypothetical protein
VKDQRITPAALERSEHHIREIIDLNDRRYEQRFASSQQALTESKVATEKRFDGVNEFRSTLADQQRTLLPRAEADLRMGMIEGRIYALEKAGSTRAGQQSGASALWAYITAGIAVLFGLGTLIIHFVKP